MTIGFIGQGYIGKNYADDFSERGHSVVRYSLEPEFVTNRDGLKNCDIVFIAVPTPTVKGAVDTTNIEEALSLIGEGKVVVIKSTILPGTTKKLQEQFPNILVLHSPEFLSKATAADDARHPKRNIIGMPKDEPRYREKAELVLSLLPRAPFTLVCDSNESEFLKYVNNTFFYAKVVYMNTLYDLATKLGCDWNHMRDAIAAEPWIGPMHIDPVHKTGRGAGGLCLIKDYAAFKHFFDTTMGDDALGAQLLKAIEAKNIELLKSTNKDQIVIDEVYGI